MGRPCSLLLAAALAFTAVCPTAAQAPTSEQISRAHTMLTQIRADLEKYYYDSTFGGMDLDRHIRDANTKIDQAGSVGEMLGAVAQLLLDFHDSHTFFLPPGRAADVEYGWRWTVVGDNCFVDSVSKGSDAEKKGLLLGDQVVAIDGIASNRQSNWLLHYLYEGLNPRPGMHVQLRHPDGSAYEVDVLAKVTPRERVVDYGEMSTWSFLLNRMEDESHARRHFWREFRDTAFVWHFGQFVYDDPGIDEMMARARGHRTLILDLRNNPGGAIATMVHLAGYFVDHPTRVQIIHHRSKVDTLVAKPVGKAPYHGNVIVLINGNSASCSEMTTRFLQLEGVATVVGDRSAGAVRESFQLGHDVGFAKYITYGVSVTVDDVIMGDENHLENVGVIPEFIVVPTGADLAARRDPQMAKALALAGIQVDPVQAAKIYSKDFARTP